MQISLPRGGASIYASSPIDLAGIVLFGPAVMAVIEGIATLITEVVLQRRPFMKVIFNVPLLVMTVGVSGLVYKAFGGLGDIDSPLFLVPLTAAGVVYYLFNTWAVSFVIALSDGRNPLHVWRQNYMWNFFHILAFLPVGAIIALLYANSGVWTIALFIIPLFLARYSFQLYLDMREAHINTVAALTSAIDASDPFTHGHSFRVSRYALRIARAMGMSSRDLEMLEYAGLLHDIGKIAIQNDILLKVGPLTEEEWRSLKSHPNIGADIVEQLKFLKEASEVIRSHHERPDGNGLSARPQGGRGAARGAHPQRRRRLRRDDLRSTLPQGASHRARDRGARDVQGEAVRRAGRPTSSSISTGRASSRSSSRPTPRPRSTTPSSSTCRSDPLAT